MYLTPEILNLLEFDKLRDYLSSFSFSILGREAIQSILPIKERKRREEIISRIKEFRQLLNSSTTFPVPIDKDIRPILKKVKEGLYHLSNDELLLVSDVTRAYREVGKFLKRLPKRYKGLSKLGSSLIKLPALYEKTQAVFDENAEVKDNASVELKTIRTGFRKLHKRLLSTAENIVTQKKRFLREKIYTTKQERIVLPVLFSKKKYVPGIVHGISQTQNTVFIEPFEIVELNNECATFKSKEQREIARILNSLTEEIRRNIECYEKGLEEIKDIDKLYAIASFSEQQNFTMPVFTSKPYLCIRGGKHPLLTLKKGEDNVVPFDIELGETSKILLISGPNMGGKTVLLKSVGLIVLMAYTGMHIPTKEDSVIPDFDAIYADIGDEQSIEMNLSTFSSHIKNITTAIQNATNRSLILLDEIGVGTDPEEGMAIAMVTLKRLAEIGALTFVTTHYGKLKHFVAGEDKMLNVSMDFDRDRGLPTYHLLYGIPGSSHGFAIAEKEGFPSLLLKKARSYIDEKELKTDELICSLSKMINEVKNRRKLLDEEGKRLSSLLSTYDKKFNEINTKEKELLRDAKKRAEGIVYSTRKEMENLIKVIRESQAKKVDIKNAKEVIAKRLGDFKEKKTERVFNFSIGDKVYSKKLKIEGVIIKIFDGYAKVESEKLHFLAPFETLEISKKENDKKEEEKTFTSDIDADFKVDIRGLIVEEAETRVTKFIDNAVLSGLETIYIIHGKGRGILREVVGSLLKDDKRVEKYRLGYWNEGGSGVTVAKLKI